MRINQAQRIGWAPRIDRARRIDQAQRIGWAPRIDRARRIDQAQLSDIIFLGSHTCHTRIDEDGWLPRRSSDPDHWSHIWHTLC